MPHDPTHPHPVDPEQEDSTEPEKNQWIRFLKELPLLIIGALIIAVLVKSFLIQVFFIPSGSMLETLQIDDRVIVNKLAYRVGDPSRGDIIVFEPEQTVAESIVDKVARNLLESIGRQSPESDLIKRVIGLPGETLEIRDGTVRIDGIPLVEPYLPEGVLLQDFGPVDIPADQYFVMGDNRGSSRDSRFTGAVRRDRIVGQAIAIIWPPADWTGL